MSPDQVERFLAIDFSKRSLWEHTFRVGGDGPDEIELIRLASTLASQSSTVFSRT